MRKPCILLALLFGAARAGTERASPEDCHQQIFFAVLEGLYQDGAANEDVERILAGEAGPELFVAGCPLCTPALDAFRVYRARAPLSTKGGDTFGGGLDAEMRARLADTDFEVRWEALEALVRRYVARRLDAQRLTKGERESYRRMLEDMRKKGMALLSSQRAAGEAGPLGVMKGCALCDAANEGCPVR